MSESNEAAHNAPIPSETLYVNNLNDRVSLNKLKKTLLDHFKKCGKVIQITAHRNLKMKGQAFITYTDVASSKLAIERLTDTVLFGKKMRIAYAKTKSDSFYKEIAGNEAPIIERKKIKQENEQSNTKDMTKRRALRKWMSLPPNKILLLQNIQEDKTDEDIKRVFETFEGFINSRFIKARNLSFLEFETEEFSKACLDKTTSEEDYLSSLGESVIITYAKK